MDAPSQATATVYHILVAGDFNPTYAYDAIGNRLSSTGITEATYTPNLLNQYTILSVLASLREPLYDHDGNLTDNGDGWLYTWDAENRLVAASEGSTTVNYTYDFQ